MVASRQPSGTQRSSALRFLRGLFADQRFLFLLVGGINTGFSVLLFSMLVLGFGPRVPSFVSLSISWTISLVLVFFAYRYIVFRVSGNAWSDFLRFTGTNVTALLINVVALSIFSDWIGWSAIPVQIGITCFVIVFNYFAHKHISFRRK